MFDKLEAIRIRYHELSALISQPGVASDNKRYQELTKELAELRDVSEAYTEYRQIEEQIQENQDLVNDKSEDLELRELAELEMEALAEKKQQLESHIRALLLPKDPDDEKNTILEIRAGTGGDEAALFARDLFRMYSRYAELRKWRISLITESLNDVGGFKEVIFAVEGKDVYSRLKFESGVHRVQRVPKTETQGRVHTSAATVAVMPEIEEVEIEINPNDLRIDVYRSSGPGGQSVNTTDSAVRVTHLPSGLVVTCQNEKSQIKNKSQALKVLRARLYEQETAAQKSVEAEQRKSMVGTGDRSEKIRTYNFPQGRFTDHRINLTLYQLESVLLGNLDSIIDALSTHYRTEMLQSDFQKK